MRKVVWVRPLPAYRIDAAHRSFFFFRPPFVSSYKLHCSFPSSAFVIDTLSFIIGETFLEQPDPANLGTSAAL